MKYEEIENLVLLAKTGDICAKELLIREFTPMVQNLSKRSYIYSYDQADVKNECFKTLFKCICLYNPDKHRFVAYATNAIKNSISHLIRISVRRSGAEGRDAYIMDSKLENILYYDEKPDALLLNELYQSRLKAAIEKLPLKERDLVIYVYFRKYTLKRYSKFKGIPYSTVVSRKSRIMAKLKKAFRMESLDDYEEFQ